MSPTGPNCRTSRHFKRRPADALGQREAAAALLQPDGDEVAGGVAGDDRRDPVSCGRLVEQQVARQALAVGVERACGWFGSRCGRSRPRTKRRRCRRREAGRVAAVVVKVLVAAPCRSTASSTKPPAPAVLPGIWCGRGTWRRSGHPCRASGLPQTHRASAMLHMHITRRGCQLFPPMVIFTPATIM